jgi:zona occludens toxin
VITLLTGLPGNGKTLFALYAIKAKAEKETREVYYHNITNLTLPWTVFDPTKWMDLPHGCIIVIDEAQDVFPKKPNGAALPDYYNELAKHRHRGFDIFLITQHPTLLDNFVRRLVGQHYHSIRKFGLERSTIYEWSAANPSPELASSQKNAVTLKWAYPKEVYTYYKSAEVHTVKRSIPMKLILAALFIVAVLGAGYYALDAFQKRGKVEKQPAQVGQVVQPGGSVVSANGMQGPGKAPPFDALADAKNFVAMSTPRIEGLPQTAPKYDERTRPVRVPVPAACIQHGKGGVECKCFSQQGTAMDVGLNMCISFARNGFFQDFDADADRAAMANTERSVALLEKSPVGRDSLSGGGAVAVIPFSEPVRAPGRVSAAAGAP